MSGHWDIPPDEALGLAVDCLEPGLVLQACRDGLDRVDEERRRGWRDARVIEALYHPGRYVRVAYAMASDAAVPSHRLWPEADLVYVHVPIRQPVSRRGTTVSVGGTEFEAYAFPNDRRLRGLRKFTGRESAAEVWQQWLTDSGNPGDIDVDTLQRLLVRYVPEQKWIARLRAEVVDARTGERTKRRLAVRCAAPSSTVVLRRRHERLSRWSASNGSPLSVPSVIGGDAKLGLLAVEWDRGDSLIDRLRGDSARPLLARVVTGLRAFHAVTVPGLPKIGPDNLRRRAADVVEELGLARPDLTTRLGSVLAEFHDRVGRLDPVAPVTLHNDLHATQFRAKDDRLTLFDLERMSLGDPLIDIANFTTQLRLVGQRPEFSTPPATATRWADEFLAEWLAQSRQPIAAERFRCWTALALLGMAHGMMRHLRPGWRVLVDRCVESAEFELAANEREVAAS